MWTLENFYIINKTSNLIVSMLCQRRKWWHNIEAIRFNVYVIIKNETLSLSDCKKNWMTLPSRHKILNSKGWRSETARNLSFTDDPRTVFYKSPRGSNILYKHKYVLLGNTNKYVHTLNTRMGDKPASFGVTDGSA